jgi:CubicO group peptidase (beta-lactamase class C family)
MKKLLGIVVLGLLLSGNAYAIDYRNSFAFFNFWLQDNGFNKYLKKDSNGQLKNNLDIKAHKNRWGILYKSNPNRDTLIYYLYKYQHSHRVGDPGTMQWEQVEIKPSKNPYEFKFNLIEDKFVKKQMQTKGILSYLYFQDNHVLIDEISPKNRLGEFLDNKSKFMSMSMNKSLTSYILGHAICEGYINGLDSKVDDWSIIKDTLYEKNNLIDLLNMASGDQKYLNEFTGNTGFFLNDKNASLEYETNTIKKSVLNYLKGSEKSKAKYNYNGFVPQLLLNYTVYKTGDDFKKILNKIFQDKVKIKHSVFMGKIRGRVEEHGVYHPMVRMTRFDYLRLAKAIMDDYQNDTCVGKYLKEIHKRRIPKRYNENKNEPEFNRTKSYGGFFHMDYPGLKNKVVFGMGGYGGRAILIDMENSRIVVLNSLHYNNTKYKYNVKKLLINPIKKGK